MARARHGDIKFSQLARVSSIGTEMEYEVVPVTTLTILGAVGGDGDYLHKVLAEDATTSTGAGATAIGIFTNA